MYHLPLNKLHGCEEKHLKHVNILKCLPSAKKKTLQGCKVKHSKHLKTRESSLLAEYTVLFLEVKIYQWNHHHSMNTIYYVGYKHRQ